MMCSACRRYSEPAKRVGLPWKRLGFGQRVGEMVPMRRATIVLFPSHEDNCEIIATELETAMTRYLLRHFRIYCR